jgi:hypothetical protein
MVPEKSPQKFDQKPSNLKKIQKPLTPHHPRQVDLLRSPGRDLVVEPEKPKKRWESEHRRDDRSNRDLKLRD